MTLCDKLRVLKIRTNADTPKDTAKAVQFGAEGIGLFRTEHMFYGEGSDKPLFLLRKMILSKTVEERKAALSELSVFVKKDIKATMEVLNGLPITIRLLDPPLHEFVPHLSFADAIVTCTTNTGAAAQAGRSSSPRSISRDLPNGCGKPHARHCRTRGDSAAPAGLAGQSHLPATARFLGQTAPRSAPNPCRQNKPWQNTLRWKG